MPGRKHRCPDVKPDVKHWWCDKNFKPAPPPPSLKVDDDAAASAFQIRSELPASLTAPATLAVDETVILLRPLHLQYNSDGERASAQ